MNVFEFRDQLVKEFSSYIKSFIFIKDKRVKEKVENCLNDGILWPDPLIQINPFFESGGSIDDLIKQGLLHPQCSSIFRIMKGEGGSQSSPLNLHKHQYDAIKAAKSRENYVLTTGTGSGKSLSYIIPIVDHVLRRGSGKGIQAIIVYPMNALANSQFGELTKFLCEGFPYGRPPVTFERYTGQESDDKRNKIIANPPDIILTNYVMLELILTRPFEKALINSAQDLSFLVLDELHTYRGRQGSDVAMLVRRLRDACNAKKMQCIGTSATLSSEGNYHQQKVEIAKVAALLFGDTVKPENIIGETIKKIMPETDIFCEGFINKLKSIMSKSTYQKPASFDEFINNPLSIWIESTFGIKREEETGRLIRSKPMAISGDNGGAVKLSAHTDIPQDKCRKFIQEALLTGYSIRNPSTGFPVFAFRLHQFISSGDLVYASIEPEDQRYITVFGQKYVPNENRQRVLLPLVFCRECGQEYYSVSKCNDINTHKTFFEQRELSDHNCENSLPGFLFYSSNNPWPKDLDEIINKVPEDWIETHKGTQRIKEKQKKRMPLSIKVKTDGYEGDDGIECWFVSAPFRFCLNCGVAYGSRQRSDFGKLVSLGNEGRSTATTILSLQAIRHLKNQDIAEKARKILSFTDNRQDASLQSGHFNDFIEVGIIRSALYKAMEKSPQGLTHDILTQKVFESLNIPIEYYASNPQVMFTALEDTKKTFKQVLGYRLYRDLKRGWRVTSPNLEQCGLLKVKYISLDQVCAAHNLWKNLHKAIAEADPSTREKIAKTLLDYLRRELAIKVDFLEQNFQDQIKANSKQRLIPPWAIDENEVLEYASVVFPRSRQKKDCGGYNFLSPRGGFGQFLRRKSTFPHQQQKITIDETEEIIGQILEVLRIAGLVQIVVQPKSGGVPGYQIPASAFIWLMGDGTKGLYDPIRISIPLHSGMKTNEFFVNFYSNTASELIGFEAREHTAQVPNELRIQREEAFREGRLPILYCSPTMELGVDISELNAVNMRNMPPTPANYAQRSGRAGRSGQPALVFTYCSTGSPHDQFFFKRPELMVAGSVTPPRLDLSNEDLIRSHINAIWLTEANISLGSSLKDILNLSNDNTELPLIDSVKDTLDNTNIRDKALKKSERIIDSIKDKLKESRWFSETWVKDEINSIVRKFDEACNRWRGIYLAAMSQREKQHLIIGDASRSPEDKKKATRLRREAEAQLELLMDSSSVMQADFYSYRYFAGEGFLPGYNFPRLPLSAYIPGRRISRNRDEFLSRPRFLAISEFGPRSIVYHEGSKYEINKVILPVGKDDIRTNMAKVCSSCGFLHPISGDNSPDLCEFCGSRLNKLLTDLFRLENVASRRRERISSDEEERVRQGFEIKTSIRFPEYQGVPSYRTSEIKDNNNIIVNLTYGQSATIWRINLGWKRRKDKNMFGFNLDTERGYWQKSEIDEFDENNNDPISQSVTRVIPFVEDRRNCLLFEPSQTLDAVQMASLQYALKNALQVLYQLEENELSAEPLPDDLNRKIILFYESAEGGAGVLRHLLDEPDAIAKAAKKALEICHFDPLTGEDLKRAPHSREDCEAACYNCLMNYGNQREHHILDRKSIKDFLLELTQAKSESSPVSASRSEHLIHLNNLTGSELEKKWLQWIDENGYRLPSRGQVYLDPYKTRPDFIYDKEHAVIYIDGPSHNYPDRQERDKNQTEALEDAGYTVIRFRFDQFISDNDWQTIVSKYPSIFGRKE